MPTTSYQRWAMAFLAGYDRPDGDAYEQHIARMAARWLRMLNSPYTTRKMVDTLLAELEVPAPRDYGCAWDDLRKRVFEWARASGWLDGTKRARSSGYELL